MTDSREKLPASWLFLKISEIADINPRLDRTDIPDDLEVSFVPMPAVEELTGRVNLTASRRFADVRKGYTPFQEGDVLFAKITPCMENGKVAIVPALKNGHGFGSTEFHVLRARPNIDARYLYYFVSSQRFRVTAARNMTGAVGQRRVPAPYLSEHRIPLAPYNQQGRIVGKIEELFSELDKGTEVLTAAREQLPAYRQAVLRDAFEGKLTATWRARHKHVVGSAKELEAALRFGRTAEVRRISGDALNRAPEIPKEWEYFRVASLCSVVRGGSPRPAGDPKYYGGSIPFLKVADLTRTAGMRVSTHTFTITEAGLSKTRMTPPDTLLISNSGATLGVPKICTFETTFNDGIAAFLGLPEGYLEYFYFFWESKTRALRGIDQGAAQPNLNTSILGEMLIPMCAKEEVKELVRLVEAALSAIEYLSTEISQGLDQASALRQSILEKAFSGQLVAQNPKDESACGLLERLRTEQEGATTKKERTARTGKKKAA